MFYLEYILYILWLWTILTADWCIIKAKFRLVSLVPPSKVWTMIGQHLTGHLQSITNIWWHAYKGAFHEYSLFVCYMVHAAVPFDQIHMRIVPF